MYKYCTTRVLCLFEFVLVSEMSFCEKNVNMVSVCIQLKLDDGSILSLLDTWPTKRFMEFIKFDLSLSQ